MPLEQIAEAIASSLSEAIAVRFEQAGDNASGAMGEQADSGGSHQLVHIVHHVRDVLLLLRYPGTATGEMPHAGCERCESRTPLVA